jgi:Predicted ATPase related to phosphate starvation-inducible protein PhoH
MEKLPKIFVLDTNVILHDYRSIYNFQENDLVIPVAVLEELDKFKKGNDQINYNAREFVRSIDEISNDPRLFNAKGFPLGKGRGTLSIEINHPFPKELEGCFKDDIQDHRILATTIWIKNQNPNRIVGLVTKDVNLRMKAKALHVLAQDYLTDHIKEERVERNEQRVVTLRGVPVSYVDTLLNTKEDISPSLLRLKKKPVNNQLYKLVSNSADKKYALARYNPYRKSIVGIHKFSAYGIMPRNDEQTFAMDAIMNPDIKLISLTGTAGTGKTLLALAGALAQADMYDQILLARPVVPLGNQEIGFLPGNANEKIGPYMLPLYDNLAVIKKNFGVSSKENVKIEDMLRSERLLISPLAYIRGRSLSKVFFIIDEAQNLTPHEVKTIITRAGEGTKIVFTGDIQQIDQPYLDKWSNGLTHISEKLYGEILFEHINLVRGERSELSDLAGRKL